MKRKVPSTPPDEVYTLTDLEQVRVLADPLRLRILGAFCDAESTTKQVAERIGEKPTRLYHHVDALERVGLLRLTRKRQNRGTVEKYYVAAGRSFSASSSLFSRDAGPPGTAQAASEMLPVVATMLDGTKNELQGLAARAQSAGKHAGSAVIEEEAVLSYLEVRGSEEEIAALRARVKKLLDEVCKEGSTGGATRRYRLTLAFFPLDARD
jgi:DNA-binding transcriptional ArsR family regulator